MATSLFEIEASQAFAICHLSHLGADLRLIFIKKKAVLHPAIVARDFTKKKNGINYQLKLFKPEHL